MIIKGINLSLAYGDRMCISGKNGSGKIKLLKAIMGDPSIQREGEYKIKMNYIGYLDQFYNNLDPDLTVQNVIKVDWPHVQIRHHLHNLLFSTNEEVSKIVKNLSGGEIARLSLAKIAAEGPQLLILGEPTNNLDLETREHLIQILNHYQGGLVSHDLDFLERINVVDQIKL